VLKLLFLAVFLPTRFCLCQTCLDIHSLSRMFFFYPTTNEFWLKSTWPHAQRPGYPKIPVLSACFPKDVRAGLVLKPTFCHKIKQGNFVSLECVARGVEYKTKRAKGC